MTVLCPTPANAGQLTSDDPVGGRSCVDHAASYAICFATNGRLSPDGATIRQWTGDKTGGLELDQVDRAVAAHTDLNFDVRVLSLAGYESRMAKGLEVSVAIGGYGPIADSRFSGQPLFRGNHAICEPPSFEDMDPLADGRRPGIYEYHHEAYPTALRRSFYAALRLNNGRLAGKDHVEAMFLRIEGPTPKPVVHHASVSQGRVGFYRLDANGEASVAEVRNTDGFSGTCSAPHLYPFHSQRLRLVHMTSGVYSKGKYGDLFINASNPRVTVS